MNPDAIRQYAREFGLRRDDAEELRDLAREQGVDVTELNRAINDLRRLEQSRALADYTASAELQAAVLERLKAFEFALNRQLAASSGPKSGVGARAPVPSEFRAQVEEYYRAIARPQPTTPPEAPRQPRP